MENRILRSITRQPNGLGYRQPKCWCLKTVMREPLQRSRLERSPYRFPTATAGILTLDTRIGSFPSWMILSFFGMSAETRGSLRNDRCEPRLAPHPTLPTLSELVWWFPLMRAGHQLIANLQLPPVPFPILPMRSGIFVRLNPLLEG